MSSKKSTKKSATTKDPKTSGIERRIDIAEKAIKMGFGLEDIPMLITNLGKYDMFDHPMEEITDFLFREKLAKQAREESGHHISPEAMFKLVEEAQHNVNEIRRLLCGLVWMSDVLEEGDPENSDLAQLVGVLGQRGQDLADRIQEELLGKVYWGLDYQTKAGVA